ncbi:MAG: DUF3688 family protein [Spiroplasma phoeniceum]|nr:MAG: DUF3688 family protein [Spiroplasma phoeniceum]UZQ33108.1 MAG: DUF3688 family protein [Spiroplasma phoeniceum]UZQ33119.1 MAG: DUF3688 family protein [Spiroplasma phoeniceum]
MRKFLVLFSFVPILLISFFSLGAMTLQQNHRSQQTAEKARTKRSVETGINENDFINTMFLRSTFFENWSDTNYFINPTLKTSKSLTYNDKWYLDFLKDSYSTGISYDKPSDKFMDLYKNWNTYSKKYNIDKFYDVDKKQFLKELTNFVYSFTIKYNLTQMLNKLKTNINDLQSVNLIEENWKLVNGFVNEKNNENKNYIGVIKIENGWKIIKWIGKRIDYKYQYKNIYRWDGNGEPQTPKINTNGELIFWTDNEYQNTCSFLLSYIDIIIQENIRVQQGGNPNYESSIVGTQRIIFDFEIVDESDRYTAMYFIKKSIYRMILTIDKNNNIIAGSLELTHTKTASNDVFHPYKETKLGFLFTFIKEKDNIFNFDANTNSYLENGNIKYYEKMKGQIDINKFLKAFFAYALVPVFQNRSNFIESGYIDNLQYDTVLINFFGLKLVNFRDVLIDENNINKNKFEKLLNSMFTVSQNFYKDYLRTIFDLENNTYTQGYNKKYGLLSNNGFKIYPRYFYFSDKYKLLDFKMYSAYKNRFYNTNYGDVFNYDFSVANNYNINQNEGYVFEGTLKNKYGLKYKKMEEQKIGYNVFELQAQKENDMYRYYDFNFGIYNWQEINNGGLFPDSQWWQAQYESCSWYNLACHIRNAAIWIVNNIPGIKQVNELASGVGKIFQTIYSFFSQTFEVWKFSPALYSTITNLFLLIIFMKFVRLI